MSALTSRLPWWSLRHRGRLAWLVHLFLLGIFAVAAVIAHTLRADRPDVWVTAHIQRWQGVDGPMRVVSWFGSAPQVVLIDSPVLRWGAVSLCLLLLVPIGPSRIYLGAHRASDVLGAYVAWQERASGAAAGSGVPPLSHRAAS